MRAKRPGKRPTAPRVPRSDCMAYDGRTLLGTIIQRGTKFMASDAAGSTIGTFKTFHDARHAVLNNIATAGSAAKPRARAA